MLGIHMASGIFTSKASSSVPGLSYCPSPGLTSDWPSLYSDPPTNWARTGCLQHYRPVKMGEARQ